MTSLLLRIVTVVGEVKVSCTTSFEELIDGCTSLLKEFEEKYSSSVAVCSTDQTYCSVAVKCEVLYGTAG